MQSWKMDPKTGDYVMDGGAPVQTDSLQMPAYFRLKTKRKKWLYAPDDQFGSDFYTLLKRPSQNAAQIFENVAAAALKPLTQDGRASSVDAQTVDINRTGAALTVTIVDASGEPDVQTFPGLGV